MREWDPVGVRDVPDAQDEYDAYVGKTYVMLVDDNADAEDIEHYLRSVEGHMGLSPSSVLDERRRRLTNALVALRPTLTTSH
jgi:hypothetical protein